MAHEITEIDAQVGIEMAWHKLTQVTPEITSENAFLNTEGEVYSGEIIAKGGRAINTHKEIYTTLADGTDKTISVMNKDYFLVNNSTLWEIAENISKEYNLPIVSAGTLSEREMAFVSFKLAAGLAGGRETVAYGNLLNDHTGKIKLTFVYSNITTVCANTFSANLRKGADCAMRKTKNAGMRLESFEHSVAKVLEMHGAYARYSDIMAGQAMNEEAMRSFAHGFVSDGKVTELSTRAKNTAEQLTELFKTGKGNDGKTRFSAFNAVTEYFTHHAGGEDGKRGLSNVAGSFQVKKAKAFDVLTDSDLFADWCKAGAENFATV